jgi:hypothetical protein
MVDFDRTERPARASHIVNITGTPGSAHQLYMGCFRRKSSDSGDSLLPTIIALINQSAIDAVEHFAVHASVVKYGDAVIAFPADSGGGKTTLAAAATMEGFNYISDEALVIDDEGLIVAYPKPMALSSWSCQRLGLRAERDETLVTSADLGGKTSTHPGRLTDVVMARFGADEMSLERTAKSNALASLIGKSFNHYRNPQRAFTLASRVASEVRVWRLDYDDPGDAIRLIASEL